MMSTYRTRWLLLLLCAVAPTTAFAVERPKWMDEPGIVMAGNWEVPSFRARRMGSVDFTLPPEKLADYAREHTPEMVAQLKELGVNFLMLHGYKGAGLQTERQGFEDTKRFAELARRSGMRVGVYIGGTMLYERLFEEEPNAPQWQTRGPRGEPIFYNRAQTFRYAAVRNHPGFIEYLKKPVRFAMEQVNADLIHFDNFGLGATSYDSFTKQQFRAYLKAHGKQLADPPTTDDPTDPLFRDWTRYKCEALFQHYAAMSEFVRSIDPDCAVECNPGGVRDGSSTLRGVDHARLLRLGSAFWDESPGTRWSQERGVATTRIRSLKVGQLSRNSTFLYCESPLDLAESMAFNVNCLGSVAWFEWGKVTTAHLSGRPIPPEMKTYIRFFLDHQDLFRQSRTVADIAVVRTFAEQSFGPRRYMSIEQALIQGHVAWRIIFDRQLDYLKGYRVVVAPDDPWLTPDQRSRLRDFASQGGLLVVSSSVKQPADFPSTLRGRLRAVVEAPSSVAMELCQQQSPQRVLVHLVNYNIEQTINDVPLSLRLTTGQPNSARLLSPEAAEPQTLPVRFENGRYCMTVPQLKVYAVVVIDQASL
jgi:hypothetical protein